MSSLAAEGLLESLVPFQATVKQVFPDGKIEIKISEDKTEIIPPVYYGGTRAHGLFCHRSIGDVLMCVRVHPGSKGVTQAIRVLASEPRLEEAGRGEDINREGDGTVATGTSRYPAINEGDVKVLSKGGSEVHLGGDLNNSSAYLTSNDNSGFFVCTDLESSYLTTVSDLSQSITSASRTISGPVIRKLSGGQADVPVGNRLDAFTRISGIIRGVYQGGYSQASSFFGEARNAPLSEHRTVINEFCEDAAWTGWDEEKDSAMYRGQKEYGLESHKRSIDPRTSLSLAPHQLIEVVAGNVVNTRGEVLDINYGPIILGNADGLPEVKDESYERDRLLSRRGLGYHFQLSTNSKAGESSNDIDNFVYAIDKEGVLKVNVPVGSSTGNILFPTSAKFGSPTGGVYSEPAAPSRTENIPVTLRDEEGNIVSPKLNAASQMKALSTRDTGIRFSNNEGYFSSPAFKNLGDGGGSKSVRINFTAHHNMYAAAEMLIANTIQGIFVPTSTAPCPGVVLKNATGQCFEKFLGNLSGEGILKDNEVKYMSTVAVAPGKVLMNPGGDTTVAGSPYYSTSDTPFSNSFKVTGTKGKFSSNVSEDGFESLKDPGGKSANINFEGAVDVSVGKDTTDQKSLVLDTAGSMIAWFGKDKSGRSLVVQTDGDVAINVGGRATANGTEEFRRGRFDLRVNVTDKGVCGEEWDAKPWGGRQASDYIISISEKGLVIAGMKPGAPMIIRNQGDLSLESSTKLCLAAQNIEVREGNRVPRKTWKAPTADDQEPPNPEGVQEKITCIVDILSEMTEE